MSINLTRTPIQLFSKRLTHIKHSQLIIKDLEKVKGVINWNEKRNYLLQSYVMNLVASWQVFIEELLEFGLNQILKNNSLNSVTIEILQSNFELNKKRFNTPNTKNIDQIFKTVLAIEKITDALEITDMKLNEIKSKINNLLQIRHRIAHTGNPGESLELESNFDFMKHLMTVGTQIEKAVLKRLDLDD